jgi:pimeloyl-ACP methyl ester carboxylesterase
MANNPFKIVGVLAGAAIGVASATYGAQKMIVHSLSKTEVDFEFQVREQFIVATRDDAKLVVYRDGPKNTKKPTILFLHGYALCSPIWSHQFDELRDEFDLVALDLRGHGASGQGAEPISLQTFADDIHDVISTLGLKDVVMVGHSTGAVAMMSYMKEYSHHAHEHVKGICLVSTLAHPPYHHIDNLTEALAKFSLTGKAFHALSNAPLIGFPMARFALGKKASNATAEFVRRCVIATDPQVCSDVLRVLADFNFIDTLKSYAGRPTKIIVGSSDPVTPLRDARILAEALGAEETIIEDVGHVLMLESPEEFNTALGEFLDEITRI